MSENIQKEFTSTKEDLWIELKHNPPMLYFSSLTKRELTDSYKAELNKNKDQEKNEDISNVKEQEETENKIVPMSNKSHKIKKLNKSLVRYTKTKNSGLDRAVIRNDFLINGEVYTLTVMLTETNELDDERKKMLESAMVPKTYNINSNNDQQVNTKMLELKQKINKQDDTRDQADPYDANAIPISNFSR